MVKVIFSFLALIFFATLSSAIVINEFTTDPQTDWDDNGNVTAAEEWIEIYNDGATAIDLANWTIVMNDGSQANETLIGSLAAGQYKTILNPTGSLNLNGQILLLNPSGNVIDSVSYGDWNDTNIEDNAPDGNAISQFDECLSRIPNAIDTNNDADDFEKTRCTFGTANGILPPNEQGLNVTIGPAIVFQVTPRQLEFGIVQSGSQNNPALNGPIVFNITGSGTDVNVEITEVSGFPFEEGLRIDGNPALGSFWTIPESAPIQAAIPTLNVPIDAQPGNNRGTIVYTISGNP